MTCHPSSRTCSSLTERERRHPNPIVRVWFRLRVSAWQFCESFSQTDNPSADARNFVLCPGLQYDRSPCGTGTSAKVACLLADEVIAPGEVWRQESIVGSIFEASAVWNEDQSRCIPTIRGTAYITADAQMILQDNDNLRFGIGKSGAL